MDAAVDCGQVVAWVRKKLAEMLAFDPVLRLGKLRVALPMFSSVNACGLSELTEPMAVLAKAKLGTVLRSNFTSCAPVTAWVM